MRRWLQFAHYKFSGIQKLQRITLRSPRVDGPRLGDPKAYLSMTPLLKSWQEVWPLWKSHGV